MLKYRASLVDIGVERERPVQIFSQNVNEIRTWAAIQLDRASANAHVVVYRVEEIEIAILKRDDQGAIQGAKSAPKETDQPG